MSRTAAATSTSSGAADPEREHRDRDVKAACFPERLRPRWRRWSARRPRRGDVLKRDAPEGVFEEVRHGDDAEALIREVEGRSRTPAGSRSSARTIRSGE